MAVVTNSRDDEKRFSDIFPTIPDFEVACIDKEIRNRALDSFLEELGYFSSNFLAILEDCRS